MGGKFRIQPQVEGGARLAREGSRPLPYDTTNPTTEHNLHGQQGADVQGFRKQTVGKNPQRQQNKNG